VHKVARSTIGRLLQYSLQKKVHAALLFTAIELRLRVFRTLSRSDKLCNF
jgi:hypothetical protein